MIKSESFDEHIKQVTIGGVLKSNNTHKYPLVTAQEFYHQSGSGLFVNTPPPTSSSSSLSISLASLPQLPTPTPLTSNQHSTNTTLQRHPSANSSVSNMIYFSSTTSEPGTSSTLSGSHYIRRAPDAIRHLGGSAERFCLPKPRIYRVLYPYKPQQIDELELQYGDLLTVTIQCDDGWFLGRSTLTGKFGTFPGNYVEPV